jgi:hypothetical protein
MWLDFCAAPLEHAADVLGQKGQRSRPVLLWLEAGACPLRQLQKIQGGWGVSVHSALMPANLISANRSSTLGSARIAFVVLLSLSIMSGGVPVGAPRP